MGHSVSPDGRMADLPTVLSQDLTRPFLFMEGLMSILAAIRREQKKVKKKLAMLQHQLSGLEAAAKALGRSAERNVNGVKKRVLSAAGRAAIAKAAKRRGAKVRAQPKKASG
jgi:hypothetical protein